MILAIMLFSGKPKTVEVSFASIDKARQDFPPRGVQGKNIAVFSATASPKAPNYMQHAAELGRLIGERGHNLVWGATEAGMMRALSISARDNGASLLGVHFEGAKDGKRVSKADVLFGAKGIAHRKDTMLDLAHVAIALPGGIGTIDEIGTFLERKKAGDRIPPLVLLSTDGFYRGMARQIEVMDDEGFLWDRARDLVRIVDTPEQALDLAEVLEPVPITAFGLGSLWTKIDLGGDFGVADYGKGANDQQP